MLSPQYKTQLLSQSLAKLPKDIHVLCPPYPAQSQLVVNAADDTVHIPPPNFCSPQVQKLLKDLLDTQNPDYAQHLTQYMQAIPEGYGEGDKFLGIKIPHLRKLLKPYLQQAWSIEELNQLIRQPWHEARFSTLLLLNHSMQLLTKTVLALPAHSVLHQQAQQQMLKNVSFYLSHAAQYINNWDLVDVSAPEVLGKFILPWPEEERCALLTAIALSDNLWERRIAVVATWPLIKAGSFKELSCQIPLLLNEPHTKYDLLNKALGWMLREIGKQDEQVLITRLEEYLGKWPSITLSYATERLSPCMRHDLQQHNRQLKNSIQRT